MRTETKLTTFWKTIDNIQYDDGNNLNFLTCNAHFNEKMFIRDGFFIISVFLVVSFLTFEMDSACLSFLRVS